MLRVPSWMLDRVLVFQLVAISLQSEVRILLRVELIVALREISLAVDWQVHYRRVRVDIEGLTKSPAVVGLTVDAGNVDLVFVVEVEPFPSRGEVLAEGAPGHKELDDPRLVADGLLFDEVVDAIVKAFITEVKR